jgi:hypothetical protein
MRRLALTSVHSESAGGCDTGEKIDASAGTLADDAKASMGAVIPLFCGISRRLGERSE